jgi:hypothetical protein
MIGCIPHRPCQPWRICICSDYATNSTIIILFHLPYSFPFNAVRPPPPLTMSSGRRGARSRPFSSAGNAPTRGRGGAFNPSVNASTNRASSRGRAFAATSAHNSRGNAAANNNTTLRGRGRGTPVRGRGSNTGTRAGSILRGHGTRTSQSPPQSTQGMPPENRLQVVRIY